MKTEIIHYCIASLLSLDAEQQTTEAQSLLHAPLANTQLAACLRAQGEDPETALAQWAKEVLVENQANVHNQENTAGGSDDQVRWIAPASENGESDEVVTRGAGHGQHVDW